MRVCLCACVCMCWWVCAHALIPSELSVRYFFFTFLAMTYKELGTVVSTNSFHAILLLAYIVSERH